MADVPIYYSPKINIQYSDGDHDGEGDQHHGEE